MPPRTFCRMQNSSLQNVESILHSPSLFATYRFLCFSFSQALMSRGLVYIAFNFHICSHTNFLNGNLHSHSSCAAGVFIRPACLAFVPAPIVRRSSLVTKSQSLHFVLRGKQACFGPATRLSPFFASQC